MSNMWGDMWQGKSGRSEELDDDVGDFTMTESFIRDDSVFYEPKMRWNKNTNEKRVKECWVCGEETNEYYSHQWRIKGGRIANIKCEHCYNEYMEITNGEDL